MEEKLVGLFDKGCKLILKLNWWQSYFVFFQKYRGNSSLSSTSCHIISSIFSECIERRQRI